MALGAPAFPKRQRPPTRLSAQKKERKKKLQNGTNKQTNTTNDTD